MPETSRAPRSASWPTLLSALLAGTDLDSEHTAWAMDQVMQGLASPAQLAGFLVALRAKGETPTEIAGLSAEMLRHAERIDPVVGAVDVVGTGGDGANTINISTMTALLVAAAGVPVIKHGNRAASAKCGAADLLEELGVVVDLPPRAVSRCVAEVGIGFCFAPVFHPAMRHAASARRDLGVPTAFNVLGPLTNPAQPAAGLVGCASELMAPVLAGVFAERGSSALVVRGDDGLDELTLTTTSSVWSAADGVVRRDRVDPEALGIRSAELSELQGGDAAFNAAVAHEVFAGASGAARDAVVLNAAVALSSLAHGRTAQWQEILPEKVRLAQHTLDSGAVTELLDRWVTRGRELRWS